MGMRARSGSGWRRALAFGEFVKTTPYRDRTLTGQVHRRGGLEPGGFATLMRTSPDRADVEPARRTGSP
jgi:hypothetical protein